MERSTGNANSSPKNMAFASGVDLMKRSEMGSMNLFER